MLSFQKFGLNILVDFSIFYFRTTDYQTMLEEISKEQKFEVTYVEVDEKTEEGESQCLVQGSNLYALIILLVIFHLFSRIEIF